MRKKNSEEITVTQSQAISFVEIIVSRDSDDARRNVFFKAAIGTPVHSYLFESDNTYAARTGRIFIEYLRKVADALEARMETIKQKADEENS